MKKQRSLIWDNYKGILIFLVVFAHFLYAHADVYENALVNKLFTFIYLFHMQAFIFCSGYFSASTSSRGRENIVKLLLYYLVFNTITMLYLYITGQIETFTFLSPYYSCWYLLSLIFWRLSIKYLDKIKYIFPISIIVALLIGYYSSFSNVLSIKRTIAFFPFFLTGYKMANKKIFVKINEFTKSINKKVTIISTIILMIVSIIIWLLLYKYSISDVMLLMGSYRAYKDILYRIVIFVVAFVMMILLLLACPNKYIPIITKAGKNSLGIYILHRFVTLEFLRIYPTTLYSDLMILYSFIFSIIVVVLFSSNKLNNWINKTIKKLSIDLVKQTERGKLVEVVALLIFIVVLLIKPTAYFIESRILPNSTNDDLSVTISESMKKKINSSIKISYLGDISFVKDTNLSKYQNYTFDEMFKNVKDYISGNDFTISVLESPVDDNTIPYSDTDFNIDINPYLNVKDSFVKAIKNSGIDLVSVATNHLLDEGYDGVTNTIDILNKYSIKHTGSYKNNQEKNKLLVVNVNGVKIAILSYLSEINNDKVNNAYKQRPYLTSIIPNTKSKNYNKFYNNIKQDFKKAKNSDADLIMVIAHMGEGSENGTSEFQDKWNQIFSSLGADIVLENTTSSVQPIQYLNNTIIVNNSGGFANCNGKDKSDGAAIVDIYIDKENKKVVASSIVPLYNEEYKDGYYRSLPIYDIVNNRDLYNHISKYELKHIESVLKHVTKVMVKKEVSFASIEKKYYFINNKYYVENDFKEIIQKYKSKKVYKLLNDAKSITFVGDSITNGSKNNHHPYYEPLVEIFKNKRIINMSKSGYTTKMLIKDYEDELLKSNSEVYVIALGTNDIRFRNSNTCAMTNNEYIYQIDKIVSLIKKSNNKASIILVAPWFSLEGDKLTTLNYEQKKELVKEYSLALKEYSKENKYIYINPNSYLENEVRKDKDKYMTDYIHPNNNYGIRLYSEALLKESN